MVRHKLLNSQLRLRDQSECATIKPVGRGRYLSSTILLLSFNSIEQTLGQLAGEYSLEQGCNEGLFLYNVKSLGQDVKTGAQLQVRLQLKDAKRLDHHWQVRIV